jgi:hypothetical protein
MWAAYFLVFLLLAGLIALMRWLGPKLDQWEREDFEREMEQRRHKTPRPNVRPGAQGPRRVVCQACDRTIQCCARCQGRGYVEL